MIREYWSKRALRKEWRRRNEHNTTALVRECNIDLVHVGRYTYGGIYALTFDKQSELQIGDFCSIGPNVKFVVSADHSLSHISTFPFRVKVLGNAEYEACGKGDIVVADDVWIGDGATILSGVHIGQGAVIAAGAVVSKDVDPYEVVGGVPAKTIRYRFSEEMIEQLVRIDYSRLTPELIAAHEGELYDELIKVEQLDWLPMRDC